MTAKILPIKEHTQPGTGEAGQDGAQENRAYARASVVVSGVVENAKETKIDCVLIDLSANGAKIKLLQNAADQSISSYSITKLTLTGSVEFPVEVAWSDGDFTGLRFLDPPAKVAGVLVGLLPDDCLTF